MEAAGFPPKFARLHYIVGLLHYSDKHAYRCKYVKGLNQKTRRGQQIFRRFKHDTKYQIFWEVVGLERGPLNLVSTIEELLERKSSGFCLGSREYGFRDPSRW
jgi:hypothetical protein